MISINLVSWFWPVFDTIRCAVVGQHVFYNLGRSSSPQASSSSSSSSSWKQFYLHHHNHHHHHHRHHQNIVIFINSTIFIMIASWSMISLRAVCRRIEGWRSRRRAEVKQWTYQGPDFNILYFAFLYLKKTDQQTIQIKTKRVKRQNQKKVTK